MANTVSWFEVVGQDGEKLRGFYGEDFFPYLTLLHGLEVTRATIAWTERVLKLLDREPARARV